MKLIECPRDAMQGLTGFIPTSAKVRYLNQLLKVGFDTIDFGSFVSPKAIPQMRDTAEVLAQLSWKESPSALLAIVANTRGAEDAARHEAVAYLGFPLSISETFQLRNTNKTIAEALTTLGEIQNICVRSNKKLVSYISMGFGNPYGDIYSPDHVAAFVERLVVLGASAISLADTIGVSTPESITSLFSTLSEQYPDTELGVHLHSAPATARAKIEAAYKAGCRRFDGAIKGFGGCPMADDELVGNLATEEIIHYLDQQGVKTGVDRQAFAQAMQMADEIFPKH